MRARLADEIFRLAKTDPRIVYIGSDLSPALAERMQKELPDRAFMEGVSEATCVGMAAGMAKDGMIPFFQTIATFATRRCYDQIACCCAIPDLPVRIIGQAAGLVYSKLGPTHQSIEDIAIMRALPNMTVVAPCDDEELARVIEVSLDWPGPMYIRLGREGCPIVSTAEDFEFGRAVTLRRKTGFGHIAFLSTGIMAHTCLGAARLLERDCSVTHFHTVTPLDIETLAQDAAHARLVVTVEDGIMNGGFGSAVLEGWGSSAVRFGLDDFAHGYGTEADALERAGLTPEKIAERIACIL